jgi:penicillin-binding protein 2
MNKLPIFEKGHHGSMHFETGGKRKSLSLLIIFTIGCIIFFLVLISRLFQLTIVKGTYYRDLSDKNRLREIIIEPRRGTIEDRKGFVLVENTEANINAKGERLFSKRTYRQPEAFSHVIGYRQIADTNDFKNDTCINKLRSGDKVGKKGIERLYECDLRGMAGKKLIEIDAQGQYKDTLTIIPPTDGETIQLSIDAELQQKAYELIQSKRAVVVGLKPKTGEVLVLTSSPAYNPQAFEDSDAKQISYFFNDSSKPLFNRATEGAYPPGSTFKMVVAAGALEEKAITTSTLIEDTGVVEAGNLKFHNWAFLKSGKTDGLVDVYKGLQRSNDIYFYKVGEKLGPVKIKEWAEHFGFQNRTGIGIEESEGIIPSPFWKEEVLSERWYLGDTYNLSIGQGYVNVTPLQVALETSVFTNEGYFCKPQLIKAQNGQELSKNCKKLSITPKTIDTIQEGMRQACAAGGTGWPFFDFAVFDESLTPEPTVKDASPSARITGKPNKKIQVGCKTGTAESHARSGMPHAWFTVYAPYENPEIVLTVMVEEAGEGSDVAAPIAKEILKMYFERNE